MTTSLLREEVPHPTSLAGFQNDNLSIFARDRGRDSKPDCSASDNEMFDRDSFRSCARVTRIHKEKDGG